MWAIPEKEMSFRFSYSGENKKDLAMAYKVNQYFPTPVLEYPNSTHFTPDKHTGVNLSTKLIIKLNQVSLYGATTKKVCCWGLLSAELALT